MEGKKVFGRFLQQEPRGKSEFVISFRKGSSLGLTVDVLQTTLSVRHFKAVGALFLTAEPWQQISR